MSKVFAKVISRQQKLPLARKELMSFSAEKAEISGFASVAKHLAEFSANMIFKQSD